MGVEESFCHLHIHDHFSYLDGYGKPEQYIERALSLGQKYLAQTNHGNVDGAIKFQKACLEANITPIIGCEAYIVPDHKKKTKGEKRGHVLLLPYSKDGWRNLLQLLTLANTDGFYYKPRIDYKMLQAYGEGLIISSACVSSFLHLEGGINFLESLIDLYPDCIYLEVMPHIHPLQVKTNTLCYKLSKKYGLPLVATHDCHYVEPQHEKVQEVLLAIQRKAKWNDPNRWRFDFTGLYLTSYEEMCQLFEKQKCLPKQVWQKALRTTTEIAERCSTFKIKQLKVSLPRVPGIKEDERDALKSLCYEGLKKKIGKDHPSIEEYKQRLEEELNVIIGLGFARYFLIVWELVQWCKQNDIMVGPGRGSVGGSLVAYLLGITMVDPLQFGLLFSRFISPARIDLPDIDLDFEDIKRHLVKQHLEELYGEECVAGVSTFMALKGKGALRDVSRVFDVPLADVNAAANAIIVRSGGDMRANFTIQDAFEIFEDGRRFMRKYPEVAKIAMSLEGQIRGVGQHAAAVVVSKESLHKGRRACLRIGKGNSLGSELLVNWDKHDAEYVGLMKMDLLGLNALTVLSSTRKLIKKIHSKDIVYEEIPLDDERVLEQFSQGNTVGCFQFGSLGLRKICAEIGVDNFETLVAINALYRPGPLRAGMATEYALRKRGEKKWEYLHPFMEDLTKETYGIVLYQEQVMRFMYDLAGLGWKTADTVRKVMSKSQGVAQFQKFREMFVEGCLERKTLDAETAGKVWDELATFGSYGFNKSHSVEYTMIAYWDMWLKVYYPAEFLACSLSYGSMAKKEDLVEEAQRLGLQVMLPKVGISKSTEWTVKDKCLYIPFIEVKGIGPKIAKKLDEFENASAKGFLPKSNKGSLPKNIVQLLDRIGAFNEEELSEREIENIREYFAFEISKDPLKKVRKMLPLLSTAYDMSDVCNIDFKRVDKRRKCYFGQMTEVRYSYKDNVATLQKKSRASESTAFGGVYGNFKDQTDLCMLIFSKELYQRKKDLVEHCSGQWLLAFCSHPHRASSLFCEDAYFEEELFSGQIDGLSLVRKDRKPSAVKGLNECEACELRRQCRAPVPPSRGFYNIMIVGEAPGKVEDKEGKGFVGDSGKLLWDKLARRGFHRKQFYVTNVVKCWPREAKTPKGKHIKACTSLWLDKEIETVKPFLILALGNTGMKYFKNRDSGIMDMNAAVEWDYERGAWICWSIHPASVLYHRENEALFDKAMDVFADRVRRLGGIE